MNNNNGNNDDNKKVLLDYDIIKKKVIIISESFPEIEWKNGKLILAHSPVQRF